jgi:hypothetical protein
MASGIGLWAQAPILAALLAASAWTLLQRESRPAILGVLRTAAPALALSVAAPFLAGAAFPPAAYHWSGHEGTYAILLRAEAVLTDDLGTHRVFPMPAGLAWALGALAPGEGSETLWLLAGRSSLSFLLALAALAAASLRGDRGGGRAASLGAVAGLAAVPALWGWSTTGSFIVPALVAGAAAILCAIGRRPAFALAWGALALASRLETAPLAMLAILLVPPADWRAAGRVGLAAAGLLGGFEATLLLGKKVEQTDTAAPLDPAIMLENLANLPLGGPYCAWAALALLGLLVAATWPRGQRPALRRSVLLLLSAVAALLQPTILADPGARHFLPASLLLVLLAADGHASLRAAWRGAGAGPGIAVGAGAGLVLTGLVTSGFIHGIKDLHQRWYRGADAWSAPQRRAAEARGSRGPSSEVLDSTCFLAVPGGESSVSGAADVENVWTVHDARLELDSGRCVQWAWVGPEWAADTRAERLDRAIRTLSLRPAGWVDPPPAGSEPWLLFAAPSGHDRGR